MADTRAQPLPGGRMPAVPLVRVIDPPAFMLGTPYLMAAKLFYHSIPEENFQPADKVVGKANFEDKDYESEHAVWPYSVKVSDDGVLAVTDTQYFRILIWKDWENAFAQPADVIIGQADLESNGQNQYGKPKANTLNWCYDVLLRDGAIWVVDTGNSRVLYFENIPATNNQNANDLFGNIDFNAIGEHLDVGKQNSERLYWPFAITAWRDQLITADTGNHRIAFYNL
jgi:hypothetical protein